MVKEIIVLLLCIGLVSSVAIDNPTIPVVRPITTTTSSSNLTWANILNGTMATWVQVMNGTVSGGGITWAIAMNGTLFKTNQWNATNTSYMLASNWNATNTSYYLQSNPFGFYNVTNAPIYLNDTFRGTNYTTFLTHMTWANAINGTLMLQSNWNATNTSYYLATNPNSYISNSTMNKSVSCLNIIGGNDTDFCSDASGGGSGSPGGSTTQVQFNDGGNFNGSNNLWYDKTGKTLYSNNTNTSSTTYTIGNPSAVGSGYTITYTSLVGDTCPQQDDLTNDGNPFTFNIWAYKFAHDSVYVQSATPLTLTITPDGTTDSCWNFVMDWTSVATAEGYQLQGYGTDPYMDSNYQTSATDDFTATYTSLSGWGVDPIGVMQSSPYTNSVTTYGDAVSIFGNLKVSQKINATGDIYSSGNLNALGGLIQMGAYNEGALPSNGVGIGTTSGTYRSWICGSGSCIQQDVSSGAWRVYRAGVNIFQIVLSTGEVDYFNSANTMVMKILGGKITEYNDVATEGYGVPSIVDDVVNTSTSTAIGTTTFTNSGTSGMYRLNYYLETTTSLVTATSVMLNVSYTDSAGYTSILSSALPLTALGRTSGVSYIQLASGSITYSTIVVGTQGTSRYALHMDLERLR
jgi:hypothetical protein